MATLTVRNISDDVKSKLRQIAARNGHSMEEEARRILQRSVYQESEKNFGSKIVAICAEFNGVDLEIPPRSLPRAVPEIFELDS